MLRLLLVEDCRHDAELIAHRIREERIRCQLTRVDSKAEFLAVILRQNWDLIITDFALPSFNAIDVLTIARARDPHVPVILLTGTKPEEFGADFVNKGATDYLLKSCLTRLGLAIRSALGRSRLERELRESRIQVKDLTVEVESLRQAGPSSIAREIRKDLEPKLNAFKLEIVSAVSEELRARMAGHQGGMPGSAAPLDQILSSREMKVVILMGNGKSLKQIAAELTVSPKTVSTYRQRILRKLRLQSNAELLRYAAEHQIRDD